MFKLLAFALLFASTLSAECLPFAIEYPLESCCFDCQPYLSVGAGAVFPARNSRTRGNSSSVLYTPTTPGTSLFSLPNVVWKNKYQTGYEINAALGCFPVPNVRAEAEFLYQNIRRKISGSYDWRELNAATTLLYAENFGNPVLHTSAKANIYSAFSNVFFDFNRNCALHTTFGGGVGIAWMESHGTSHRHVLHVRTLQPPLDETSPTIEKSPKLYGTAFAWQVRCGIRYQITELFTVGINYRLFGTTRFQASKSSIVTNPNTPAEGVFKIGQGDIRGLLNNSININVECKF